MAYKLGLCAQCDKKIMVRNAVGGTYSVLPIYRQMDISFDDGTRMRVPLCRYCAEKPDVGGILKKLTAKKSQAFNNPRMKAKISAKKPLDIVLAKSIQGKALGEV